MRDSACGLVFIHSTPSALRPHIEWAIAGVLDVPVRLHWTSQPASPGTYRAEYGWDGEPGTSARLASALKPLQQLRFEVTEDPTISGDGCRYSYTPSLGVFHAITNQHGDVLIHENRLKAAIKRAAEEQSSLEIEMSELLGEPWDLELEVFRQATEDAPVRWLHAVV